MTPEEIKQKDEMTEEAFINQAIKIWKEKKQTKEHRMKLGVENVIGGMFFAPDFVLLIDIVKDLTLKLSEAEHEKELKDRWFDGYKTGHAVGKAVGSQSLQEKIDKVVDELVKMIPEEDNFKPKIFGEIAKQKLSEEVKK